MSDYFEPGLVQARFNAQQNALAIERTAAQRRFKAAGDRNALEAVLLLAFRQAASQSPELFVGVDLPRLASTVAGIILSGEAA
jgi:hypothetical protein